VVQDGVVTTQGLEIAVTNLTKRFGAVLAVDDLTMRVAPGRVTGFLGPNGAGKTTTLRILLGLVAPTAGTALIGGHRYRDLPDPVGTVGAALEASGFHPGRSARDHLRVVAAAARIPERKVDEVLGLVGLTEAAGRPVRGFSLGMRQRLALAVTVLGDPGVLVLDEPANGLDPSGIAWLRQFLRFLAGEGRTVLLSSHVLSEVEQTVDDVVIINRGRLIRQAPLAELHDPEHRAVHVRTPVPEALREALAAAGLGTAAPAADGLLRVEGTSPAAVGKAAFAAGVELHELCAVGSDLETIFLSLTSEADGR
jgi:ABC-2 type transport system ATP-binding protein